KRLTPKRAGIITDARNRFLRRREVNDNSSTLISADISLLRDSAIALEKTDLLKSYHLMKLAAEFRRGPYILKKLKEYEKKLNAQLDNTPQPDRISPIKSIK